MDEWSVPSNRDSRERCYERLRAVRFGDGLTCVHCESTAVVKRGTTDKDAQQYWCKTCETYFNDLTGTVFGQRRFGLEEMFYIVAEMDSQSIAGIARDIDRDYEAVRDFVHVARAASGTLDREALQDLCAGTRR